MANSKGFKFGMLNIRSLWLNIDEFRIHFSDFDVVGLCETWLNNAVTDNMISLFKRKLFRLDRNTGKCGGGLVLYVKDHLFDFSCMLRNYSVITPDLEQLWVCINVPNNRRKIIGVVYRPPAGSADRCLEMLRSTIENVQANHNAEITIMGDLNINYKLRNSSPFKILKDIEREFGLKQLINEPTRITSRSATLIDLILTDSVHIVHSGVMNVSISDHQPVYYIKKKQREHNPKKVVMGHSYKNYDKDMYQADISMHQRWGDFWEPGLDVNVLWDIMLEIIEDCANTHSPYVKMYVNENCPYWYSKELIEEINFKKHLYRKAKLSNS